MARKLRVGSLSNKTQSNFGERTNWCLAFDRKKTHEAYHTLLSKLASKVDGVGAKYGEHAIARTELGLH